MPKPKHLYRHRDMAALAKNLGFEFSERDDYGLLTQLQDFRLFKDGRDKRVERILRKQDGLMEFDISIFDYSWKRWGGSGNADKRVYQTVFFIQSNALGLPELWLQPETLTHKIGELLGMTDIDFVRYPKFSGQYRLTGGDEEYIRHHFNDEVLNYFTLNKGWSMEGVGFYLMFYRRGLLIPTKEIEQFYQKGVEVYQLLSDQTVRTATTTK